MNRRTLLLLLLLVNWTAQFSQTQVLKQDTTKCYGPTQLRAIAIKLIAGAECDTLLKVANAIILADSVVIKSQAKTIITQDTRYLKTEHLVDECETAKTGLKNDLKSAKTKLTWTQVGWATTAVVLSVLAIIALIK